MLRKKCFICEEKKSKSEMEELVVFRNFFKQDPARTTTRATVPVCKKCKKKLFSGFDE